MKEDIIKILEKYSEYISDNTHDGYYIGYYDFEQVAEEIEKLIARNIVQSGMKNQDFAKLMLNNRINKHKEE